MKTDVVVCKWMDQNEAFSNSIFLSAPDSQWFKQRNSEKSNFMLNFLYIWPPSWEKYHNNTLKTTKFNPLQFLLKWNECFLGGFTVILNIWLLTTDMTSFFNFWYSLSIIFKTKLASKLVYLWSFTFSCIVYSQVNTFFHFLPSYFIQTFFFLPTFGIQMRNL